MKRIIAAAALAALLPAAPALAAEPQTIDFEDKKSATWRGAALPGFNVSFFAGDPVPGACGTDPTNYCDTTLVKVEGDYTGTKSVKFRLDGFTNSDYDLRVYRSNEQGARVSHDGSPTGDGGGPVGSVLPTGPGDFETKTVSGVKPGQYLLVDIVYFTATPDESPQVTASLPAK